MLLRRGEFHAFDADGAPHFYLVPSAAVFRLAKPQGLLCSYVSNGNGTEEVLEYLRPFVSLYKVDLKAYDERSYREMLGGRLSAVLDTVDAFPQNNAEGYDNDGDGAGDNADTDDDGDGIREVHCNTAEGMWTDVRNFLRPFKGVHKKYLHGYVAICEFRRNLKRISPLFISALVAFHTLRT